ncbi:nucleotidyltransferase, partial [Reyranella sp.]|uniref:nucleotidyltransferase n=1 Tax=Reyranella sp. TaxID=1929291 RepID=UPI0037845CFA
EIYGTLAKRLQDRGYTIRRQNVSLNIRVGTIAVDLVPARRQDNTSDDHSLYRRKADTWTKTNVINHINYVRTGGRIAETRVLKLWRDQHRLDFPSFYLEMVTILALSGRWGGLSDNVWTVLQYLRDSFVDARFVDPANTNNIISDDLTANEKSAIRTAATQTLAASNWSQIVT